jgi:Tfp pilus assembly protein PilX
MRENDMNSTGRRSDAARGFTLIEVMISATILFVLILLVMRSLNDSSRLLSTVSVKSEAEIKAEAILSQITQRFRNGVISTLTKGSTPTTFATGEVEDMQVEVRLMNGYNGTVVQGKTVRISKTKDEDQDGIDNDGDGYIDEWNLYLREWPDGNTGAAPSSEVELKVNMKSYSFTRENKNLHISVVLERIDPTNQQTRTITAQSTVTLRN